MTNFADRYFEARKKACVGLKGPYGEIASRIVFHRNGICGTDFYAITFKMKANRRKMLAVGWIHARGDDFGDYGVSTPEHPDRCWRGDHYVDWFKALAKRYREMLK